MPRRSVSSAEKGDEAPTERRVTRASTRKSVDGTSETASPEKQKPAEKAKVSASEVKASPSGKRRGRPPKRQGNVTDDTAEHTGGEEAKMEVDNASADDVSKKGGKESSGVPDSVTSKPDETQTSEAKAEESAVEVSAESGAEPGKETEKDAKKEESKQEEPVESKKRQREEESEETKEESNSKKHKSDDANEKVEITAASETENKDSTDGATEKMETTSGGGSAVSTEAETAQKPENESVKAEESSASAAVDGEKSAESESKNEQTETKAAENGASAPDAAGEQVPVGSEKPIDKAVADTVADIPVSKTAVGSEPTSEATNDVADGSVKQNGCHEEAPAGIGC